MVDPARADEEALARGRRVKGAREALGLSQHELAEKTGLNQGFISKLEAGKRGERAGPDVLRRLAEALGVPYEQLSLGTTPRERTIEPDQRYGSQMAIALVHLAREFPNVPHEKVRAAVEAACAPMKNAAPDASTILARARAALSTQKAASKGKETGRTVDVDDDEEIVIPTKPKPKKPNR